MLTGQTTIRRVVARCPARTEPLVARVRLGRLLQGADLAPPGMPPQAVLVVRSVEARHNVSLAAFRLRPEWEREAREEVARNWRRAVRPARGRVPPDAEAVWFEDVSEWLAALGLAVRRREVERHWCWQASHGGSGFPTSTSATLVRAWSQSPRFVPAAVVRLARWGEAAPVLGLLGPAEADTLLSALAAEFDLAHAAATRPRAAATPRDSSSLHAPTTTRDQRAAYSSVNDDDERRTTIDPRDRHAQRDPAPPWKRWLAATDGACERLDASAQRLLSFAAALFHSPTRARTRDFAAEVAAFVGRARDARAVRDDSATTSRPARHAHTRGDDAATRGRTRDLDDTHAATSDAPNRTRPAHDASSPNPTARDDGRRDEASATPTPAARRPDADTPAKELPSSSPLINRHDEAGAEELAAGAAWRDLEGHETALGGVLFLLNFFIHLRLPECFDEDFRLSEHVTGWGLAEAIGRALLSELADADAYDRDPLWGVLARLDGRSEGEPTAAALRVGDDYRTPARWLKHFVADDAASLSFHLRGRRLVLRHAGGFTVAAETLAGRAPAAVAARLVADYRAQGVALEGADEAVAKLDERHRDKESDEDARRDDKQDDGQTGLGRWMKWTLPFMKYVLARALAEDGEALTGEGLARTLLLRRGRVYATATHVDLVLGMNEVLVAVRRAGFDASPGWVRDLVRVVAFHYE